MQSPKTTGEKALKALLDIRGIVSEYELPEAGKKRIPDFTLTSTTPPTKVEVKDFDLNDEDTVIAKTLSGGKMAAWSSDQPYSRIRRAIHDKADQLKEYGDAPNLIVFTRSPQNLTVDLSTNNILESMLGDYVVEITLGKAGKHKVKPILKPKNAAFGPKRNIHVSAVAVIEEHRPNQHIAEKIGKQFVKDHGEFIMTEEGQQKLTELFDVERKRGIDLDLVVSRFRIMHNPYAKNPLPIGFFNSEYDEEIQFDSTGKAQRHYRKSIHDHKLR